MPACMSAAQPAPPAILLDEEEECNIGTNPLLVTLTANSVLTFGCGTGREGARIVV